MRRALRRAALCSRSESEAAEEVSGLGGRDASPELRNCLKSKQLTG